MNTNNTSNPPFRINQKVVAIKDHSNSRFKKGDTFFVTELRPSTCGCIGWEIRIGEIYGYGNGSMCSKCGADISDGGPLWFDSSNFAPIEENKERIRYVAVSETLREKAEEVIVESCTLS